MLTLLIQQCSCADMACVWVGDEGDVGAGCTGSVGGCDWVGAVTWQPNELWVVVRQSESLQGVGLTYPGVTAVMWHIRKNHLDLECFRELQYFQRSHGALGTSGCLSKIPQRCIFPWVSLDIFERSFKYLSKIYNSLGISRWLSKIF